MAEENKDLGARLKASNFFWKVFCRAILIDTLYNQGDSLEFLL